eukprot:CAMPEP_0117601986 /NCGR_PEP_ID=MMETSP0784-20121206/77331_1 /TAXON_ID=39447 /ORGANISM="" /LENGTH=204 /DNA_ID=CAMNT_0005404757 /DNA_START=29 /DNA_END=643 /DNA_ORIENTATION=-
MRQGYFIHCWAASASGASPVRNGEPSAGANTSAEPSTQYRRPVRVAGVPTNDAPSRKRSPTWPPQAAQLSLAPVIASNQVFSTSTFGVASANASQPVRESNLSAALNNVAPQPPHRNSPARLSRNKGELFGASVPPRRRTNNRWLERLCSHSASLLQTARPQSTPRAASASAAAATAAVPPRERKAAAHIARPTVVTQTSPWQA